MLKGFLQKCMDFWLPLSVLFSVLMLKSHHILVICCRALRRIEKYLANKKNKIETKDKTETRRNRNGRIGKYESRSYEEEIGRSEK